MPDQTQPSSDRVQSAGFADGSVRPQAVRRERRVPGRLPMNKACHAANPMPPKATLDQRIRWHSEHARACACRPSPDNPRKDVQRLLSSAQEKAHGTSTSHA
jgi:hypothetical protein